MKKHTIKLIVELEVNEVDSNETEHLVFTAEDVQEEAIESIKEKIGGSFEDPDGFLIFNIKSVKVAKK